MRYFKCLTYLTYYNAYLTFEAFVRDSIFDKTAFCLGEKSKVYLVSVLDRRKEILYGNGSAYTAQQNNPTPECMVNGTECYDG